MLLQTPDIEMATTETGSSSKSVMDIHFGKCQWQTEYATLYISVRVPID